MHLSSAKFTKSISKTGINFASIYFNIYKTVSLKLFLTKYHSKGVKMNKTALILGLCLTGSAFAVTNTSTTDNAGDSSKMELSRWSVGIGSVFLQAPNRNKGTDRLHGLGVELQREIKLQNGLSTNTIANISVFSNDENDTETYSDGSVYKNNYEVNMRNITISQSITKNISTKLGTVSMGGSLGLTELRSEGKNTYSDTGTDYNSSGSYTSEYKAYGQTIGVLASLKLNNGIMPFVSYRTTSFNDFSMSAESESSGITQKGSFKVKDIDVQAVSVGVGYKF